jgi:uncharacterized protein YyaL (SSP411 family)
MLPADNSQNRKEEEPNLTNHLRNEKSPYLIQHLNNPVDWYPWGEIAFEKARVENKPIFLSIGYSTCHWCHVMAHESFEDEEVASLMNEVFVSIKVDREERPDIDAIYMKVALLMNGSGGWPLTIIMTPAGVPFFAATYIPKTSRFGRSGMLQVIPIIQQKWQTEPDDLMEISARVSEALNQLNTSFSTGELNPRYLDDAFRSLSDSFDLNYGGFGSAPKFPSPHNFLFLLRYWHRTKNEFALEMVSKTLDEMRKGGIYDQVGFGFHRYSTDAEWFAPHFEKMLYDQAMLAMVYTEAYLVKADPVYERTAREVLTYVIRDMTDPGGGFYSAEDADSEGEEGKYYLWNENDIRDLLPGEQADFVIDIFNVEREGNFSGEHGGVSPSNILFLSTSPKDFVDRWEPIRQKMFFAREKRIKPHKDKKILTDWNGLMIAAFAKAAQAYDAPEFSQAAQAAAEFILNQMLDKNGRLMHRYNDGEAGIPAMLDDYAFLIWGLQELYETTFDLRYLESALELQIQLDDFYWDELEGGYFLTASDAEELLTRPKEIYDGAIPSGNSVSMLNLLRFGRITGKSFYDDKAASLGKAFSGSVKQAPAGFTALLCGLDFAVGLSQEIVIVGEPGKPDAQALLRALHSIYAPNKVVLLRSPDSADLLSEIAEFTRHQASLEKKATAYVCTDHVCQQPTTDIDVMLGTISQQAPDSE